MQNSCSIYNIIIMQRINKTNNEGKELCDSCINEIEYKKLQEAK